MKDFLVVDGYNIIHAWPILSELMAEDLSHARDRLIDIMSEFQAATGTRVVIVFDAHLVKGGIGGRTVVNGLEVFYSQEGETADNVIEKLVSLYLSRGRVVVATSDWIQQRLVFGKGASRMSARELLDEVTRITLETSRRKKLAESSYGWLSTRVNEDVRKLLERMRREK